MTNPYREHMDKIQAMVKQLTREHLYTTRPEERYMDDSSYGINFVVASGGNPFDTELESRLKTLMKEVTGDPDPETM